MSIDLNAQEIRKRKREQRVVVFLAIGFVLSTLIQASISGREQGYGFVDSLLYFGMLHLNVILIMFLVFLVTRNLVKAYLLRRSGRLGSSLRWKMVTSLLAFSMLPSIILFAASSLIIRQGFDRWFGNQVAKALDDAQSIAKVHYDGIENNLQFFSQRAADQLKGLGHVPEANDLIQLRKNFPVQAVEIYPNLFQPPLKLLSDSTPEWAVPPSSVESLQRAFRGESFLLIRQYGDGDLVQRFTLVRGAGTTAFVIVLSETVPLGLKTRMAELEMAFASYQKTRLFKDTLKRNYTLILLTLFVLILFVVSWFGLYIARSVTDPVAELMKATEAFREGQWDYRIPTQLLTRETTGADLEVLKAAFNLMAEEVGRRGRQLEDANGQLISLVRELEERERYLEILLSSIRRGVLVLNTEGRIQRINQEALQFSAFAAQADSNPAQYLGRDWRELFSNLGSVDEARIWLNEISALRGQPVDRIFEVNTGTGRTSSVFSVRATGIRLLDERAESLGWLMILEDVSDAARLERLAAWQEVAKRVAHEIKNPLTPIQISADRLYRRLAEDFDEKSEKGAIFHECVLQIQKQVRVIRDLVREFSQFAKLPEPKLTLLQVPQLIEDILADYRFTHPACDIQFENLCPTPEVVIRADPEYMRRLVVNLADNAMHVLEEGKVAQPKFKVTLTSGQGAEPWVQLTFDDNGPGVPPAMREKIFDPYYTSKASGLGLGLAIVRRIAMEHMGRVRCEEAAGGRFVLELPRVNVEA